MTDGLFRLTIQTSPAFAAVLEEALPAAGHPAAGCQDMETGASRLDLFCETQAQADELAETLRALLPALAGPDPWTLAVTPLRREDWAESWKAFFHAQRVSPRLIVRPSWEDWSAAPGEHVITLDAGMAFGTGTHGTTRACLRFLDDTAAQGGSLLDAGCGSGILAIAAARLGYRPITAIDPDPTAIETARANARANGVEALIAFETASLETFAAGPFDCVAANIEAPILLAGLDTLAGRLTAPHPGTRLILSGILDTQYATVRDAFSARGFLERDRLSLEEWTSGLFERA